VSTISQHQFSSAEAAPVSGGAQCLGRAKADANYWAGAVAECGIATAFSDATAVASLDAYLAAK